MKLMVTGSREWEDWDEIKKTLQEAVQSHGVDTVVHGGAAGADSMAGWVAREMGLSVEVYKAQWTGPDGEFDKAAGYKRNIRMIEEAKPDLVVAFWDGTSKGTKHALNHARRRRIPVRVVMANEIELSVRDAAAREGREREARPALADTQTERVARNRTPVSGSGRARAEAPPRREAAEESHQEVSASLPMNGQKARRAAAPPSAGRDSILFALTAEERSLLQEEQAALVAELERLSPKEERWAELAARRRRIHVALAKDEFARAVELRDQGVDYSERPAFEGMTEDLFMNLPASSDSYVESVREMRRAEREALRRDAEQQTSPTRRDLQERAEQLKEIGEQAHELAR